MRLRVAVSLILSMILASAASVPATAGELSQPSAADLTATVPELRWKQESPESRPWTFLNLEAAYDPGSEQIVMYVDVNVATAQTWTWDGTTWTQLDIATPTFRFHSTMTTDEANGNVILFGGEWSEGSYLSETWVFSDGAWSQVQTPVFPPARRSAAMSYDPILGQVLMFGGYPYTNDTWAFDGATWTELHPSKSPGKPRSRAGLAYDPGLGKTIMFGGLSPRRNFWPSTTWAWDGSTWDRLKLRRSPTGRAGHMMATVGGRVVMYGGDGEGDERRDMWIFGARSWHKVEGRRPPARENAAFALDERREEVVLFGGFNSETLPRLFDTWTLDPRP